MDDNQITQLLEDGANSSGSECGLETTFLASVDENISDCEEAEDLTCSEADELEIDENIDCSSSSSQEDHEEISRSSSFYRGKNRFKWSKTPPAASRVRQHNIVTHLPGLKGEAREKINMSELKSWELLFPDDLIEIICLHTNKKITEFHEKCKDDKAHSNYISLMEMRAFMGLMLLTGVFKSGHEDVESLWATDATGRDVFRITMSIKRFLFILSALRFDEIDTREERKENDRAALISEIFNKFIGNCQKYYTCSEYVTVDEMLCPFRGRCLFRVYMKSKPARYGIKVLCLCDAKTHYLYNAFIYTGKSATIRRGELSIPTQTVLQLAAPIMKTNRNITGDNWFSSVELVDKLKEHGLTYVGTMRKNKREVPKEFLPHKTRSVGSSIFGFTNDKTLASYIPKKNKSVVMISTMHHNKAIDEISGKPEIITFYNATKGGVDALDQKCANYSVARRTQRWPCVIFSAIMNISMANGHILWTAANLEKRLKRRKYIKTIGIELVKPFVQERMKESSNFSLDLRTRIQNFLKESKKDEDENIATDDSQTSRKRGRCYLCDRKKDVKCTQKCSNCLLFICKNHITKNVTCTKC